MRVVHTYSVLLDVSDLLLFFATGKFRVQSPAFVDALRQRHPSLRAGDCARFALPLQRVATLKHPVWTRERIPSSALTFHVGQLFVNDFFRLVVWRLRTALGNCLGYTIEQHINVFSALLVDALPHNAPTLTTVVLCACEVPQLKKNSREHIQRSALTTVVLCTCDVPQLKKNSREQEFT